MHGNLRGTPCYTQIMLTGPDDPRHGTASAYTWHKCRCTRCSAFWAARTKAQKEARVKRGLPPDDPRHGTNNAYSNWNCRCQPCVQAHKAVMKYRAGNQSQIRPWTINDIVPDDLLITQKTESK